MSRLWIEHDTDKRGHGGKEHVSCTIYYGSSKDSKSAISVSVEWLNGTVQPVVKITRDEKEYLIE